jgi:hypothetical protein
VRRPNFLTEVPMTNYLITPKDSYFLINFIDKADKPSVIAAYAELINHDDFHLETHTIWDYSNAVVELTIPDIQEISELVRGSSDKRSSNAKAAFIATDPSDRISLQNYITATAFYPVEFMLFKDMRSALEWLSNTPS